MQGIIAVNKPAGPTSFDCVAVVRRILKEKAGHTGTLDPEATGVLPICVGNATRLIEYMSGGEKSYRCLCKLGLESDTFDIWGNITGGASLSGGFDLPSKERLLQVLKGFEGEIVQTPPLYSAVKVKGKKLYEYARKGKSVEIPQRKVNIKKIELLAYDKESSEFTMDVSCLGGTYIRSLCSDIGRLLGCGALMAGLVRLKSSGFDISEAVDLDLIKEMSADALSKKLFPAKRAVSHLRKISLNSEEAELFMNGRSDFLNKSKAPLPLFEGEIFSVFKEDFLLGTAKAEAYGKILRLKPCKVLK